MITVGKLRKTHQTAYPSGNGDPWVSTSFSSLHFNQFTEGVIVILIRRALQVEAALIEKKWELSEILPFDVQFFKGCVGEHYSGVLVDCS